MELGVGRWRGEERGGVKNYVTRSQNSIKKATKGGSTW